MQLEARPAPPWGIGFRGKMERGLGTQGHRDFYWGAKSAPWRGSGWSFPGVSFQGQRCFSFSFRMASSLALVAAAALRGNPSSSRPLAMLPPDFPELFAWRGRQHRSLGLPVRRRAGGGWGQCGAQSCSTAQETLPHFRQMPVQCSAERRKEGKQREANPEPIPLRGTRQG